MRAKKTYIAVARKLVHAKKIFLRCAKISTNKVYHSIAVGEHNKNKNGKMEN